MQHAFIEDLNRQTKESYAQREKQSLDRIYFLLRRFVFEMTVINRVRQTLERTDLLQATPSVNILDVGCKYGDKTDAIVRATVSNLADQINVRGIDLHLPSEQYRPRDPRIHLERSEIPLEQLSTKQPHAYDVISAMAVTHHFPDLDCAIAKMRQLLAPKGIIFMADSYYQKTRLAEIYTKWYEKLECDGYFNRMTQQDVLECMRENHLEIVAQMWGFPWLGITLARHKRDNSQL